MMERNVKVKAAKETGPDQLAHFVQVANQYTSTVYIEMEDNRRINAKSIMGMMNFSVADGKEVIIRAEGEDALEAVNAMMACLSGKE